MPEDAKLIFVTGVNGHVGNTIVRDLLENGYRVRGSVRSLSDPKKTEHVRQHASDLGKESNLELVEGDVLNPDGWSQWLEGCDGLFHTATVYATSGDPQTILDTANKGTMNLFNAAKEAGISRVIYTSSIAAVGSEPKGVAKDHTHWQEGSPLPYTVAKTESERLAWRLAEELNLDLRVINPGAVLGGGFSRPTPSTNIIGEALKGKYPMAPKFPLAFVHVKDVAIAHRRAFEVETASGRYITAPHSNTDIHQMLKRCSELYPKSKAPKLAMPSWMLPIAIFQDWFFGIFTKQRQLTRTVAKSFYKGDANYDSSRASEELGIQWHDVDTCIRDTVEAYQ